MSINNSEAFAKLWQQLLDEFTGKPIPFNFKEQIINKYTKKALDI